MHFFPQVNTEKIAARVTRIGTIGTFRCFGVDTILGQVVKDLAVSRG